MRVLNKLISYTTKQNKTKFEDFHDIFLIVLGIPSFLIAGYWGVMLGSVIPKIIKIVNEKGLDFDAIPLALSFFALGVWFFGCIAARCHSLIYERWFK